MNDFRGQNAMAENLGRAADLDLDHLPGKPPLRAGRSRKEHFQKPVDAFTRTRRPGDRKRTFSTCKELRIEQQERKCAEVIAVQMRNHDPVDQ